ncbi:NAD(P)-dependent nickel-iron dehydrogenase catalytic subunit [Longilinea arvoryzae]|uniref:NAD(P)-dependent nickel-iron dehydrogenase catalytic subunit n=1 Tax=Longilinea arvoryzae TaxID=360412 RepID=A0A0S7BMA2_9CHLR|nr:Ni/Fe hydrogenase subunit alpha [Longilinea arvoryzae]GAP14933.1 NAD(P)-dependent nickel-iron dehydrogenase catalytic subunit [Longilinea arvoryzae]
MVAQKITIEPVTRIEGHAKVTIRLDDTGKVDHAYLHVNEFRGFEKFCEGRMVFEMPLITPRICGICPVSHHLAAAKAADETLGCPPPRPASLLRELMHMGQVIQSHGMHFFELAGPDLLLGFDADPAIRNVVGIIQANPELAVKAVSLRKYGQEIISTLGGRRIHPNFAIPGGVNKALTSADREKILAGLDESIQTIQIGISVIKDWVQRNAEDVAKFAPLKSGYLGLVTSDNSLELYDGQVRLVDVNGDQLEKFDGSDYLDYIAEHVESWSYLKFPYYKKLGWPKGVYRVGPLGRLNTSDQIDTPLANKEHKIWKSINAGRPVENTLYYHYARLIEALYAAENVAVLLNDPDILSTDILNTRQDPKGEGVGVIEAPRGTLIHHYKANANGQLEHVNLIVATGHNNWAMSEAVDSVAKTYITGPHITEGMLNRVEAAVRAHDPCLSCSTHAVGQMPIIIEMIDAQGNLIQKISRD